jgi:flagellar biogenesis protein FliO
LAWALPLVLFVGTVVMLILRHFVQPAPVRISQQRLTLRSSLSLSEKTCVHLLDVDGKEFLVVESAQQADVQPLATTASEPVRRASGLNAAWLQRFQKGGAR